MDAGPSVSSSPSRMSSSSNSIISLKSSVLEIASYTLLITLTILLKESETAVSNEVNTTNAPNSIFPWNIRKNTIEIPTIYATSCGIFLTNLLLVSTRTFLTSNSTPFLHNVSN